MNARIILIGFLCCFSLSIGECDEIKRYCFDHWCERIGYSQAVAVGDTLYLSGIVANAETMEECLATVLNEVDLMLQRFDLPRSRILKEKIYTNNKDALREATSLRKDFYRNDRPAAVWIEAETHRQNAWIEMELTLSIPDGHVLPDPESSNQ